jgi:hypothetical protein
MSPRGPHGNSVMYRPGNARSPRLWPRCERNRSRASHARIGRRPAGKTGSPNEVGTDGGRTLLAGDLLLQRKVSIQTLRRRRFTTKPRVAAIAAHPGKTDTTTGRTPTGFPKADRGCAGATLGEGVKSKTYPGGVSLDAGDRCGTPSGYVGWSWSPSPQGAPPSRRPLGYVVKRLRRRASKHTLRCSTNH